MNQGNSQIFKTFINGEGGPVYRDYEPEHVIYGDTDSIYIGLNALFDKQATEKEVTDFADELGTKTNNHFPAFMKAIFNVDKDRAHVIHTEREVVSDKSLFLAKKKYCMNVVNDEGKVVNKLKTMGVELTRTDTADCVKELLRQVVILLMDGSGYQAVRAYVDNFKKKYHTLSPIDIGRPTSIRTLAKYEAAVAHAGGDLKACRVGHAKAALVYNARCRLEDRKIRAGDKIVVVYLTDDRFTSIALPRDADQLPSWVNDLHVDWKKQWDSVEKKLNIYLKPVGYDYDTRQSELVNTYITF